MTECLLLCDWTFIWMKSYCSDLNTWRGPPHPDVVLEELLGLHVLLKSVVKTSSVKKSHETNGPGPKETASAQSDKCDHVLMEQKPDTQLRLCLHHCQQSQMDAAGASPSTVWRTASERFDGNVQKNVFQTSTSSLAAVTMVTVHNSLKLLRRQLEKTKAKGHIYEILKLGVYSHYCSSSCTDSTEEECWQYWA